MPSQSQPSVSFGGRFKGILILANGSAHSQVLGKRERLGPIDTDSDSRQNDGSDCSAVQSSVFGLGGG